MTQPSSARMYLAYLPVLGCVVFSFGSLFASEALVPEHFNLRGPVLILRWLLAVIAAVVLALPAAVLAVWALGPRGRAERVGAACFCWLITVPGAYFLLDSANVVLSSSKPQIHTVTFVKTVSQRKGSGYDVLSSWRAPGETVSLTSSLPWGTLKPGDALELEVCSGALGWEYISAFRPLPKQS